MGCDIHCYIEYKRPDSKEWSDFGGRINPGRNYSIFAAMAGVRGNATPVVPPRGYPEDAAYAAEGDNWLYITKEKVSEAGECTRAQADQYVAHGMHFKDDLKQYVSHPDWHSHSWLTPDEYAKAIEGYDDEMEYRATLAALRSFEAAGCQARLVFWFDN